MLEFDPRKEISYTRYGPIVVNVAYYRYIENSCCTWFIVSSIASDVAPAEAFIDICTG